ncbi:MAG: hypothetical protein RMI34_03835 [Chloroherpetonaceae bacterium]|nr:hypothetical protein [Chloroherpetonaceae bacterium]MDW8019190.1 hypothetical protein [Chloroherpetonaceae bacterium]
MTFEFEICEHKGLVSVFVSGTGNFQNGVEGLLRIANDTRFREGFNVLVDICQLNYSPSLSELRAFADVLTSLKDRCSGRTALVVSNFLHFGLGNLLSRFLELSGIQMRVFFSMQDATHWLSPA